VALAFVAPTIASVARVEVPAALWKKVRIRELAEPAAVVLETRFASDFENDAYTIVEIDRRLLASAAELPRRHSLASLDAIHLACAAAIRDIASDQIEFVCADRALAIAAEAEGFEVNALA